MESELGCNKILGIFYYGLVLLGHCNFNMPPNKLDGTLQAEYLSSMHGLDEHDKEERTIAPGEFCEPFPLPALTICCSFGGSFII